MVKDRIVSVGFLTSADLRTLGAGFTRHFPVPDDDIFADLLDKLDKIEAAPAADTVILRATRGTTTR